MDAIPWRLLHAQLHRMTMEQGIINKGKKGQQLLLNNGMVLKNSLPITFSRDLDVSQITTANVWLCT